MQKKFIRHGDVNLYVISKEEYEKLQGKLITGQKRFSIKEGEATGHNHIITANEMELKLMPDMTYALKIGDAIITHEDHKQLDIPGGYYRQIDEREIDNFADFVERKVID
jgi:hypothetical protein